MGYRRRDGAFLPGRGPALAGGREHTLPAPLDELPLLVRAGAVLPLLPADVDTLAPYGRGRTVRLSERRDELTLLAFPRGRWRGRFGERGRLEAREGSRSWCLAITAGEKRTYTLRAALGALRRPFRPGAVTVGGRPLPRSRWRYDARTRTLTARFDGGRRTRVQVAARL